LVVLVTKATLSSSKEVGRMAIISKFVEFNIIAAGDGKTKTSFLWLVAIMHICRSTEMSPPLKLGVGLCGTFGYLWRLIGSSRKANVSLANFASFDGPRCWNAVQLLLSP
jgi:hypothetical protein